jgi:hypothetical protein
VVKVTTTEDAMTTNTATALLDPVGKALVAADLALGTISKPITPGQREATAEQVKQALVSLACAACDAVARWEESERAREADDASVLSARVTSWRSQLEDLRVQAALAQMEMRSSPHQALVAVEQSASALEKALVASGREIAQALHSFRTAVRPTV